MQVEDCDARPVAPPLKSKQRSFNYKECPRGAGNSSCTNLVMRLHLKHRPLMLFSDQNEPSETRPRLLSTGGNASTSCDLSLLLPPCKHKRSGYTDEFRYWSRETNNVLNYLFLTQCGSLTFMRTCNVTVSEVKNKYIEEDGIY